MLNEKYSYGKLIYENGEYYFASDRDKLKEYNNYVKSNESKDKNNYIIDYLYHLDVLPQPFFGNIENPKVLFLALNPSYDIESNCNDNDDVKKFYDENKDNIEESLDNYINKLKEVDFFCEIDSENKYYVNSAIAWWQRNVFKDIEKIKKINKNQIGFINFSPYHSKRYLDNQKNSLEYHNVLQNKLEELQKIENLELIVVTWGKTTWDNFIKRRFLKYDNLDSFFNDKIIISLNKTKKIYNNSKYNEKINSISDIVTNINEYKERYRENEIAKLNIIFEKIEG